MKAVSLWQPWASAVPLGLKRIETRGWATNYRGHLVIHAAKRWGQDQRAFAATERTLGRLPQRLPLGQLVAVVKLVDVQPVEALLAGGVVGPVERIYGDYGPGRYGWVLEDVVALPEPIPFAGKQGFFNVPDELLPPSLLPTVQAGALL